MADRQADDPPLRVRCFCEGVFDRCCSFQFKGETDHAPISFIGQTEGFSSSMKLKTISLTSTTIGEVKRMQLADGSLAFNEDLAKLLRIDTKQFEQLTTFLHRQGFQSFGQ